MRQILALVFIVCQMASFAQEPLNLNNKLPVDPKVSKGVFVNGMTYYVRANSTPQNRAEMYLVLKAGSIDEDSNQKGLAHFCEHMAFNGTKNFPKNELSNYLESIGMEFGPEINAYTSFEETVYTIKVPLDNESYIENGLQVLYDWACQISFNDDDIEAERGIIREEWRIGQGAEERMLKQWLPVFMHQSKYASYLPIGELDIIENCPTEDLRKYYNDWYRPDLMAVIVVGDFDQQEMEEKVKNKFSRIPAKNNPREKILFEVPEHKETLISIATDKEAPFTVAQVIYKHPLEKVQTLNDYRNHIILKLYNGMINKRLGELIQKENPPFIRAETTFDELFGPMSIYHSFAICETGKVKLGLQTILEENERVKKHGFTQSELDRQKAALLKLIERFHNEQDKFESSYFANEYKRNFLITEECIPGSENEYNYYQTFLPDIKLAEVNALTKKWITEENRVVIILAPKKDKETIPEENEIMKLLDEVKNTELTPYSDNIEQKPLIEKQPSSGKIISKKVITEVDAEEWKLDNGATVVIKNTNYKNDQILFSAYSPGGSSLYGQDDDISADIAAEVLSISGIAEFDQLTLDKMLSDKVFQLSPYISDIKEGFSGKSSVTDLEPMLQMLYLYFTDQRIDSTAFKSYINRIKATIESKEASPKQALSDTFLVASVNYHPRKRPLTTTVLDEANLERIKTITKERFSNANDFTFFFVGNICNEKLQPLVEKYIASLPSSDKKEKWENLHINSPEGVVEKQVLKGEENKSVHYTVFHGDFDYSHKNVIQLKAVGKILTARLLKVIREEKSDVYYINAKPSVNKHPDEKYSVFIYFGSEPVKVKEIQKAIFSEIKQIIKNGPSEEEIKTAKEKLLRERESYLQQNKYWLGMLSTYYRLYQGDFSGFDEYEKLVHKIDKNSIKKTMKDLFNFDQYFSVTLLPEQIKQ